MWNNWRHLRCRWCWKRLVVTRVCWRVRSVCRMWWKTVITRIITVIIRIYSPLFHQVLCLRKSKIDRLSGGPREHSLIKLSRV